MSHVIQYSACNIILFGGGPEGEKGEHARESRSNRALDVLPVIQPPDFDLENHYMHQTFRFPTAFAKKMGEGGGQGRLTLEEVNCVL